MQRFFKITESNNYRFIEHGYAHGNNHAEALKITAPVKTKRIFNERFREIETSGHFFYVEEVGKGNKTFIFEIEA